MRRRSEEKKKKTRRDEVITSMVDAEDEVTLSPLIILEVYH